MPHKPVQSTIAVPCFDNGSNHGLFQRDGVTQVQGIDLSKPISDVWLACWDMSPWLDAPIWADGFQMLCQWRGSLAEPQQVSRCADNDLDYRRYDPGQTRFYNYLLVELEAGRDYWLVGFTDCYRFNGYFECDSNAQLRAVVETESLQLRPEESISLPQFVTLSDSSIENIMQQFAERIQQHHGVPRYQHSFKGWCSWYHYYEHITTGIIADNAQALATRWPQADLVLIDDGYQRAMGDWLIPSDKFAGGVEQAIAAIQSANCQPGIWLAPFIAEQGSQLVAEHPEWFIKRADGTHLTADEVTYGGWRCTPWLLLDTSQDGPCQYLEQTVAIMKRRWGISLFKLDALYWGALNVARRNNMTSVEAYRRGLAAIKRGAGDACVLGCNAPMWPSLGLIDAMRTSDDVHRHQHRFHQLHLENAGRSWQHRKLWLVDQDCVTLMDLLTAYQTQTASAVAYEGHACSIFAHSGNLILGDAIAELSPAAQQTIDKLMARLQATEQVVSYQSLAFDQARLVIDSQCTLYLAFNLSADVCKQVEFSHGLQVDWFDFWQGIALADQTSSLKLELAPNQGRIVVAKTRQ